jgi:glutathione S-transferase
MCLDMIDIFDEDKSASAVRRETRKIADRFLLGVERRLQDREWIACDVFTVADILLANVLRSIRKTDMMDPYPKMKAYYERCHARPAWDRALRLYAE